MWLLLLRFPSSVRPLDKIPEVTPTLLPVIIADDRQHVFPGKNVHSTRVHTRVTRPASAFTCEYLAPSVFDV
jgi:hypothetical protein